MLEKLRTNTRKPSPTAEMYYRNSLTMVADTLVTIPLQLLRISTFRTRRPTPDPTISQLVSNTAAGPFRTSQADHPRTASSQAARSMRCARTSSTRQKISKRSKNGSNVMLRPLGTVSPKASTAAKSLPLTTIGLGTCSMAPKEGNSVVKHGVLDPRLNVHGVKGLKCADLSICPDNVGCNTYSTALLIGEKAAMLIAEDLGYSGDALKMEVPVWHNGTYETTGLARL